MVLAPVWALLAVLALVLSWVTGAVSFAWVGYLMLAIWLIGLLAVRLGERGLVATRRLSADCVPFGGQVGVEMEVTNRSWLPVLWLVASETLPAGLALVGTRGRVGPLSGHGRFSYRYTLQGTRRGYFQIGPTLLRTGDLFGLAHRERTGAAPAWLTVYPRIVPITRGRLPSGRPAGEIRTRQRVLEDPTQVIGVRPYQQGDGLRRVHWRATAHTGRLQSKLFELSAQMETIIVLDLRRDEYPGSPAEAQEMAELAIVAAASLAQHTLDYRQRTGLLALAADPAPEEPGSGTLLQVPANRGREQLAKILSALGRVQLGPGEKLAAVLEREKKALPWGALLLVIMPRARKEVLPALVGMRKAGFELGTVLVGRRAEVLPQVAGLQTLGISAMPLSSEVDIRGLAP